MDYLTIVYQSFHL